jgi:glutamate synthase domain-containing protein 2
MGRGRSTQLTKQGKKKLIHPPVHRPISYIQTHISQTNKTNKTKQTKQNSFGVTSHYLANSDQIQIKMAQGAKPGMYVFGAHY